MLDFHQPPSPFLLLPPDSSRPLRSHVIVFRFLRRARPLFHLPVGATTSPRLCSTPPHSAGPPPRSAGVFSHSSHRAFRWLRCTPHLPHFSPIPLLLPGALSFLTLVLTVAGGERVHFLFPTAPLPFPKCSSRSQVLTTRALTPPLLLVSSLPPPPPPLCIQFAPHLLVSSSPPPSHSI